MFLCLVVVALVICLICLTKPAIPIPTPNWQDTMRWFPYMGTDGRLHLPFKTQCRIFNGEIEYREREETHDEWIERQV